MKLKGWYFERNLAYTLFPFCLETNSSLFEFS